MGLGLPAGGHLTHGWNVSISGKYFTSVPYGVRKDTGRVDMDEVADAGAVRRGIVGAVDRHGRAQPQGRLAGELDQVGVVRRGLADPCLGIGTRDVEVAQDGVAQPGGGGDVGEGPHDANFCCDGLVSQHPM